MKTSSPRPFFAQILIPILCFLSLVPLGARADFASDVLALTNAERQKVNLPPLIMNSVLVAAAQGHAVDMANNDYFSHTGLDGSSFTERVARAGGTVLSGGENIAAGQPTPSEVVASWMASPGHRANILNPEWRFLGVGYTFLPNDGGAAPYGHYWVQVFAGSMTGGVNLAETGMSTSDGNTVFCTPGGPILFQLSVSKPVHDFKTAAWIPDGLFFTNSTGTFFGKIDQAGYYRVNVKVVYTDHTTEHVPVTFRVK